MEKNPQPKGTPDQISSQEYFYWAKKEVWTLEQAAQLAVGLLPSLQDQHARICFINKEQEKRYQRLLLSLKETEKKETVAPSEFFIWTNRKRVDVSRVLIKQIKEALKANDDTDKYVYNAKEQHSLLLMLGAIIQNTYQKDSVPYAKDSLTTEIRDDLVRMGVHMDDATILKFIRRSYSSLSDYLNKHPIK